eukprot:SAG31_NODE_37491_length_303_cov_9.053922_1_plen_26_part_01
MILLSNSTAVPEGTSIDHIFNYVRQP